MDKEEKQKYRLIEHLLFPKTFLNEAKLKESLKEKTVLITGASFGIGESLSLLLGTTDAKLILIGRTKEKLLSVQNKIIKGGGFAEIYVIDLRNDDEIQSFIQYLKKLKRLDVLVNNAGKSIRRPLVESLNRYHDFSRTMAINYEAPVKLILALLPKLEKNHGHIINISALNVLMAPAPYWTAYQASKSAFDQWFRSASPEIEHMGITTTSIYLPLVKTRMISPTKAYDSMPAMKPNHVAKIICKCLIKKKRRYKPWWSFFGEIGSVLFRKTWEQIIRKQVKKQRLK